MGTGGFQDSPFLIDFGIAKQYRHQESRVHIPMQEYSTFVGTPAYTSLNGHHKQELSRRDDLESLAYTLMFLHSGSLPWLQHATQHSSHALIQKMKESTGSTHNSGVPMEILSLLTYARNLTFTQKPDYDYVRALFLPAASLAPLTRGIQSLAFAQSMSCAETNTHEIPCTPT